MFFHCTIALLLILTSLVEATVQNSIVPIMERFEHIENLSPTKYSKEQFQKITDALKGKRHRVRIVTYNMLFNLYDQNVEPENRWPERLPRIVELVNDMKADIIGVTELERDQLRELMPFMKGTYSFFFRGPKNTEQDGVFYRTDRFKLIGHRSYKLQAETLTIVWLKDRKTGKTIAVANTHFAFAKIEERTSQAHFVAKKMKSIAAKYPAVFMGDLNTFPNWPNESFPALDGDYVNQILSQYNFHEGLRDSMSRSVVGHLGPISTFTNKEGDVKPFEGTGSPGVILDHIYVSERIQVLMHAVQSAQVNGHFPSDHMPVIADCLVH